MASTRVIANNFGKSHKHVLEAARKLILDLKSHDLHFDREITESEYTTDRGKTYRHLILTKDAFTLLAMGFTGKKALEWKLKYINAFNSMADALTDSKTVMDKCNEAVALLESDREVASCHAKGLVSWKKEKKLHMDKIDELHKEAQILLGF